MIVDVYEIHLHKIDEVVVLVLVAVFHDVVNSIWIRLLLHRCCCRNIST